MNFNNIKGYVDDTDINDIDAQLKKDGRTGIVFDPSGGLEGGVAPANLPNVTEVLTGVQNILQYMCNDDIIKLKSEDESEYINHMEGKFPAFSFRYYSLFQKIISGDNLTHLFSMLAAIEKVKNGETTLDEAEKGLGEQLAQEYVYPHVNKKNKR